MPSSEHAPVPEAIAPGRGVDTIALDDAEGQEAEKKLWPRIYVASLTDYNNGYLHGAWIEAAQDPECLEAEIQAMLARSRFPGAEEWAIHDTDEFGPVRLSEWERLQDVSAVAKGLQEHGAPFGHYVNIVGTDLDDAPWFLEAYQGCWQSLDAYAEEVVDELGFEEQLDRCVPDGLRSYVKIDVARFRDELAMELRVISDEDGVHVFRIP